MNRTSERIVWFHCSFWTASLGAWSNRYIAFLQLQILFIEWIVLLYPRNVFGVFSFLLLSEFRELKMWMYFEWLLIFLLLLLFHLILSVFPSTSSFPFRFYYFCICLSFLFISFSVSVPLRFPRPYYWAFMVASVTVWERESLSVCKIHNSILIHFSFLFLSFLLPLHNIPYRFFMCVSLSLTQVIHTRNHIHSYAYHIYACMGKSSL